MNNVIGFETPFNIRGSASVPNSCSKNIKYTGKVMVAVNHEYVDMSHLLYKNDEVAFFPPVTGG